MSDVIDIDALAPKSVKIKLGGDEFDIQPPKTVHIMRIGKAGQRLSEALEGDSTDEELDNISNELNSAIALCVPEIANKELGLGQLKKLIEILTDMSIPEEAKELKKRGISTADPKAPQD